MNTDKINNTIREAIDFMSSSPELGYTDYITQLYLSGEEIDELICY